jgi:UDP-N-acetylglucosamine 2-epimerase (non-hydrolysing)
MLVLNVVGARPNFMKIAPVDLELRRRRIPRLLVHTGQHYDDNMSTVFFDELGLPKPDIYLGIGSDTQTRQTARVMTAFEEICRQHQPDLVVVGGDVNSTLAASLVAAKEEIPIAHVEAGLRSFDRSMPEEINRTVTDHLSDLLFTTERSANLNLVHEGIDEDRIHFVGNCMMDTLERHLETARKREPWRAYGLAPRDYALLTLHRPANVDQPRTLSNLMTAVDRIASRLPVLFPVHPRTHGRLDDLPLEISDDVRLLDPLPYLEFLGLMSAARCVLTDSGGIQEETTMLRVPCLTLRENTERPITLESGTNRLVGLDPDRIVREFELSIEKDYSDGSSPPLWDGHAAIRVVDTIESWLPRGG